MAENVAEFTADDGETSSDEEDEDSDDGVAEIAMLCSPAPNETRKLLDEKLAHLAPEQRQRLRSVILKHNVIARDLHDLRPASVPLKHTFTLNDYTPIAAPIR